MKKILLYIFSISLLIASVGCQDDFNSSGTLQPSLSAHYLSVSQSTFEHTSSAAFTDEMYVSSVCTPWKFSGVADWLNVAPISGNESSSVILSGEENNNASGARMAVFYLESADPGWKFNRAISVTQAKATAYIRADETHLQFNAGASSKSVSVASNCEWNAKSSESWISLTSDLKSGTLSIAVSDNPTNDYRTGDVYLEYDYTTYVVISVTQNASGVTANAKTLTFENVASKYSVTIESDVEWTSTVSSSWIMMNPNKGKAGKTPVEIEVSPNTSVSQRTGYVTIKTGSEQRLQIAVIQKGIYIDADKSMTFSSQAESRKLKVKSNTSWSVKEKPSWLTLSKSSGQGDAEITVTSTENASTSSRSGKIVLGQTGLSIDFTVDVTQLSKTVIPETTALEFSDKGGTSSFNLIADYSWTSSVSDDWFVATPTYGNSNATISVTAQENKTINDRTGTITYSFLDKKAIVSVHQLAKYFNVDNKAFEFDTKGGTHTIDISTNDKWTLTTEQSAPWLKISKTSGSGDASISLTAADNASMNPRSCVVVINSESAQSVRITISQKARYLKVSAQSLLFFAKGGTSQTVKIDSNGDYTIKTDGSWFTINQSGNTFSVTSTKNPNSEPRTGRIIISMTDLKEGSYSLELSVMQAGEGGSFIIDGYQEDVNWDNASNGKLSVTVNNYTSDKNWDSESIGKLTVVINGYPTDSNWN